MLGYSILLSFLLLFNIGQVFVGLDDGYPFDASLLVYGIGGDNTRTGYTYCTNSSGCMQTICQLYQSNTSITHIVVDPTIDSNSTCSSNIADIFDNDVLKATVAMMTLGGALAIGRMIISITVRVGYRRLYFALFLLERATIVTGILLSAIVTQTVTLIVIAIPTVIYDIRKIYFRMMVLRNKQLLETGI